MTTIGCVPFRFSLPNSPRDRPSLVAVPDGEHVYRDRLEALPDGLNAEQLARRGTDGLTPDHDSVARRPNILDGPVQVRD